MAYVDKDKLPLIFAKAIKEFDDLDVPISEVAIKIGQTIRNLPTADVEEVTYCKDCEWSVKRVRNNDIFPYQCVNTVACGKPRRALDFCSYGMK